MINALIKVVISHLQTWLCASLLHCLGLSATLALNAMVNVIITNRHIFRSMWVTLRLLINNHKILALLYAAKYHLVSGQQLTEWLNVRERHQPRLFIWLEPKMKTHLIFIYTRWKLLKNRRLAVTSPQSRRTQVNSIQYIALLEMLNQIKLIGPVNSQQACHYHQ